MTKRAEVVGGLIFDQVIPWFEGIESFIDNSNPSPCLHCPFAR